MPKPVVPEKCAHMKAEKARDVCSGTCLLKAQTAENLHCLSGSTSNQRKQESCKSTKHPSVLLVLELLRFQGSYKVEAEGRDKFGCQVLAPVLLFWRRGVGASNGNSHFLLVVTGEGANNHMRSQDCVQIDVVQKPGD